jgi:hypothetical protein
MLFFFLFVSSSFFTYGQKIALLSPNSKYPIIYTDSVTVEQIHKGFFTLEVKSLDTFYANLKYIKEMLSIKQRSKMQSFELRSGLTVIKINRIPLAYADRYSIVASSKIGEIEAVTTFGDLQTTNKNCLNRIENMMKYLDSNKSLFRTANEIHPRIYEVVVVADH